MKKALIIAVLLWVLPMLAQSFTGELRLTVIDPSGLAVKSTVELVSQGNQYRQRFTTDDRATWMPSACLMESIKSGSRRKALRRFPSRWKYVPLSPWIARFG